MISKDFQVDNAEIGFEFDAKLGQITFNKQEEDEQREFFTLTLTELKVLLQEVANEPEININ